MSGRCVAPQGGGELRCESMGEQIRVTAIQYTDDSITGPHEIGFEFTFYGEVYTQFYTTSNGTFHFARPRSSECCSGYEIPSNALEGPAIAAFWGDINAPDGAHTTLVHRGR
jgi:hypothetical protein